METKSINSMPTVYPNLTRKILSGDGAISLEDLEGFLTARVNTRVNDIESAEMENSRKVSELSLAYDGVAEDLAGAQADIATIKNSLSNIAVGSMAFNAVKFAVVQNGTVLENEFGYLVMKKSAAGNLTFGALTQAEYEAIFGGEQ